MLYKELNKTLEHNKTIEAIYDTIELIVNFATCNNLDYYICGGTALMIYNGSIYRENEDLEFSIDNKDKDIWVEFLKNKEFKFEKNASDWPLGNKKEVYRSKIGFKIELILLEDNKIKQGYTTIDIKDLNIRIYEPINVLNVKTKYVKYKEKIIRTKDKIDILHFKQYILDNTKNIQ
jgi:hypothetical protein